MQIMDIVAAACIVAALVLAFWLDRRRRRTSSCCGDCSKCERAARVPDRVKAHYPHEATAEITGMTCQSCAVRVENAINELEGVWASVRIDSRTAIIRSKTPIDEKAVRERVLAAGYGVGSFRVEK